MELMGVSCQSSIYLHGNTATHLKGLVNRLFISMALMVLIGSVLSIIYSSPWCQWYCLKVYCQSSIFLLVVNGTLWCCLVNRLFMVPQLFIGSALSIVYLPLWCQWYSLEVSCQSSVDLHDVIATYWECLVICLFVSMVSLLLIWSVLSILYLSPWCHSYSLGMPYQSSNHLHSVNVTIWEFIDNRLFNSMVLWLLICQSFNYLHDVNGTQWECLVNRLFISVVLRLPIGSALSIVYLSTWCQWFLLGVSCQSSIYFHGVNGTHWECLVNRLFLSMVSMQLIWSVLLIVYFSPWCHG